MDQWKMVPVVPTAEMLAATLYRSDEAGDEGALLNWQGMLAAAPEPPDSTHTIEAFNVPRGLDAKDELKARFRIQCRRCGSDDIALNLDPPYRYSENTVSGASVQIGCNGCGENDWIVGV